MKRIIENALFYGVLALTASTIIWLFAQGYIIPRFGISWDKLYMKIFVAMIVLDASIHTTIVYLKRPEYRFSEWRLVLKGVLLLTLSTILDLCDELVTIREYGLLFTLKIPPLAGALFLAIGIYLWLKKITVREPVITPVSSVGATITAILLVLAFVIVSLGGGYAHPSFNKLLQDIFPEICMLAAVVVWTLMLFTRGSDNWSIQLIIDFYRLSGLFFIIVLSLYILEDLYAYSPLSLFFLKKSFEIVALGVLIMALTWSSFTPVTLLASASTSHMRVSADRSILLEVDTPSDAASVIKNTLQAKEYCTIIFTKKKSPLREKLSEENLPIIFCYLEPVSYPKQMSDREYEVSAEQAHIIYLLRKMRSRCRYPFLLVFDNLTDLTTEKGLKKTYLIAREILSFLEERDRALFILIKKAHSEPEKALLYSLFEKIVSL